MRIVLDTSVFVSALRAPRGASGELLRLAAQGYVVMVASTALMIEYEAVATRLDHLAASGLSADDVAVVLDTLAGRIAPVVVDVSWRPQLIDPDDDMVLDCAVNGRAAAIFTHNTRHFLPVARRFGVDVLTPRQFFERA